MDESKKANDPHAKIINRSDDESNVLNDEDIEEIMAALTYKGKWIDWQTVETAGLRERRKRTEIIREEQREHEHSSQKVGTNRSGTLWQLE